MSKSLRDIASLQSDLFLVKQIITSIKEDMHAVHQDLLAIKEVLNNQAEVITQMAPEVETLLLERIDRIQSQPWPNQSTNGEPVVQKQPKAAANAREGEVEVSNG